jgi:hypothetical protein
MSPKKSDYKVLTPVETSDDMDLSFDNVDLDQPWLSMSIEEVNSMSIE